MVVRKRGEKMTKSKCALFLELARPDRSGWSRWVSTSEYVGRYASLFHANGWDWGRAGSELRNRFNVEIRRAGNRIEAVRLAGFNSDFAFSQTIRPDIKAAIQRQKCVMLGVNGSSVNTRIEVDHKDGRKNNPRVSNMDTQLMCDFQPLCKAANDVKRQICKECKRTNRRWDAKNIKGNPYSFYEGDVNYTESLGCVGCYQYDPVAYRVSSAKRLTTETLETVMRRLYPEICQGSGK